MVCHFWPISLTAEAKLDLILGQNMKILTHWVKTFLLITHLYTHLLKNCSSTYIGLSWKCTFEKHGKEFIIDAANVSPEFPVHES